VSTSSFLGWVEFFGEEAFERILMLTGLYRLGLSDFLRGKLVERLKEEEKKEKSG